MFLCVHIYDDMSASVKRKKDTLSSFIKDFFLYKSEEYLFHMLADQQLCTTVCTIGQTYPRRKRCQLIQCLLVEVSPEGETRIVTLQTIYNKMADWLFRQVSWDRPATTQFKELSHENVFEKSLQKKQQKQLILSIKEPIKGPSGVSLFTVSIKNKGVNSVNKSYSAERSTTQHKCHLLCLWRVKCYWHNIWNLCWNAETNNDEANVLWNGKCKKQTTKKHILHIRSYTDQSHH